MSTLVCSCGKKANWKRKKGGSPKALCFRCLPDERQGARYEYVPSRVGDIDHKPFEVKGVFDE